MNIGIKLREHRNQLKLSQANLSSKTGVPQTTISDYERGITIPNIVNLQKIAKALGVTVSELLNETA